MPEDPKPAETPETSTTKEETYEKLYGTKKPDPPAATATLPQDVLETLQSLPKLVEKVTTLESRLAPPPPPPADPDEWVEKIRVGDFKGAKKVLFDEFRKDLDPEITRTKQESEQRAITAMKVQMEIDRYLNDVRSKNPELAPYERYLKAPVEAVVNEAVQAGRIKTPEDYIKAYSRAVDTEVEALRNLRLQERGGGKQEALTRKTEVLSATPLAPNQTTNRTEQPSPETSADETPIDYITRRQQATARLRRLD